MNEYGNQPLEEKKEKKGGLRGAAQALKNTMDQVFTGETELTPEQQIANCSSFNELRAALVKIGPIDGRPGSGTRFTPESNFTKIDLIRSNKKHFNVITSSLGLRDKVIELYHNEHAARIAKITSFSSLIALLNAYNGLQGNSELYTAEFLVDKIQTIMTDNNPGDVEQAFIDLTNIGNLKFKARELYDAHRQEKQDKKFTQEVLAARSFEELFIVLNRIGDVTSETDTYTVADIKKAIYNYIKYGNRGRLTKITRKYGIRSKVEELHFNEKANQYDQSRSGQGQQYDRRQESGGQRGYNQQEARKSAEERQERQELEQIFAKMRAENPGISNKRIFRRLSVKFHPDQNNGQEHRLWKPLNDWNDEQEKAKKEAHDRRAKVAAAEVLTEAQAIKKENSQRQNLEIAQALYDKGLVTFRGLAG